jgi:hypothetical protein
MNFFNTHAWRNIKIPWYNVLSPTNSFHGGFTYTTIVAIYLDLTHITSSDVFGFIKIVVTFRPDSPTESV